METKGFFQFEIIINVLVSSFWIIRNIFTLTVWESTLDVRICLYRRQILTTKVDPHTVSVNMLQSMTQ